MVKIAALVTVRNTSSRLPDKAIKTVFKNKRAIEIVIERAKKTGYEVILCTSVDQPDHVFEQIALENNIKIFRGDQKNKIRRWYGCFVKYKLDAALLIDGDDLLYDYNIGKRAIDQLMNEKLELLESPDNIVCGFFTYAISKAGITKLYSSGRVFKDTDVITEFVNISGIKKGYIKLEDWEKDKQLRLTLDYEEDLEMFKTTFLKMDYLAEGKKVVDFYFNNPSISNINLFRQQDFLDNKQKFNQEIRDNL
jgi:spore coat polysaccharide biosynthesis protein SpsF